MMPALVLGSRGKHVQILQHLLNSSLPAGRKLYFDGFFGEKTQGAVRAFQAIHHLTADGIVGPKTWRALVGPTRHAHMPPVCPLHPSDHSRSWVAQAAPSLPPVVSPNLPVDGSAPWLTFAELELGVAEIPGARQNNARIIEYHSTTTLEARTDEVPWCSSFVNWCVTRSGRKGANNAAAASWKNWGRALSTPRRGAITVIHRKTRGHDRATGSSSGNHVAFYIEGSAASIRLLGGNQSDMVKYSNFPLSSYEVLAYRWPA